MGTKFGTEGIKFHPHRCNGKGIGPQKLKFLLQFDQNVEYKRPTGAYPLRDFHNETTVPQMNSINSAHSTHLTTEVRTNLRAGRYQAVTVAICGMTLQLQWTKQ